MALEADDEADADKEPTGDVGDELDINPQEVQMLKQIIKPATGGQSSTVPKSGIKQGLTHLDGGSGSLDSSGEDLDASRGARTKKKTSMPTKASHPNQWSKDDIDIVHQICYKMDLQRFQTYRTNKIDPTDLTSINTRDHSAYLEVAQADLGSVIKKSVFSVAVYRATLKQQGGNTSKFDKEVGTNFKKGAKGSWAPDSEKVPCTVSLSLFADPERILRRLYVFAEEPCKSTTTTSEPCSPVFKEVQPRPSEHSNLEYHTNNLNLYLHVFGLLIIYCCNKKHPTGL